jgi:hypothetical protein
MQRAGAAKGPWKRLHFKGRLPPPALSRRERLLPFLAPAVLRRLAPAPRLPAAAARPCRGRRSAQVSLRLVTRRAGALMEPDPPLSSGEPSALQLSGA